MYWVQQKTLWASASRNSLWLKIPWTGLILNPVSEYKYSSISLSWGMRSRESPQFFFQFFEVFKVSLHKNLLMKWNQSVINDAPSLVFSLSIFYHWNWLKFNELVPRIILSFTWPVTWLSATEAISSLLFLYSRS